MKWSEFRESRRQLAQTYRQTLSGVPQDPDHHPEGDVLTHVQLVRKAIPRAIQELTQLKGDPQFGLILADLDFAVTPQEQQILALAAWLHDIGKVSATTIGGKPWTQGGDGRIQAIGHENPEHYGPQLEKLKDIAPPETVQLYLDNKDLLNFLIEHHMDFTSGSGFGRDFVSQYFQMGKVKALPEMKLLLILMWADKMGRRPEDTIAKAIGKNATNLVASSEKSRIRDTNIQNQSKPFGGGPEEFARMIGGKPIAQSQKVQALKNKFPYLTDDQIATLLPEGFRGFLEMAEMQPNVTPANIPVDKNIRLLAHVLKQSDPAVEVYVVGGAVRDWLFHHFQGKGGTFKPKDMDLTTNLSEEEILERLRGLLAVQQGIRVQEKQSVDTFGVVFASVRGSETYEIAPFRKDIGVADGRRPDRVERGNIQDDAMRRDLTINNLYYDFDKGVILDFNQGGQGIEDIKNGVARPVGDPHERFNEDKLRILRLVRFFSRFNSGDISQNLDPKTANAIEHFRDLKNNGITPERIHMEFMAGIKQSQNTASFLQNLVNLRLIDQVFPKLQVDVHGISRLGNLKNPKVVLAWLLRSNRNVSGALNQLKYPNDISEAVQFLVDSLNFGPENAMNIVRTRDKRLLKGSATSPTGAPMSAQEIDTHNQQISSATQQDLNDLAKVVGDPTIAARLTHLSSYQPPNVSGEELMQQGFQGPAIGIEQKRRVGDHYNQSFQSFQPNLSMEELTAIAAKNPMSQEWYEDPSDECPF